MNLTSIRDPREGLSRHLLDSLAALSFGRPGEGELLVDLGSGNGYPAIPLLTCWGSSRGVLVEKVQKKADFLHAVLRETGLASRVQVLDRKIDSIEQLPAEASWFTLRAFPEPAHWIEQLLTRPATERVLAWLSERDSNEIKRRIAGAKIETRPSSPGCVVVSFTR